MGKKIQITFMYIEPEDSEVDQDLTDLAKAVKEDLDQRFGISIETGEQSSNAIDLLIEINS